MPPLSPLDFTSMNLLYNIRGIEHFFFHFLNMRNFSPFPSRHTIIQTPLSFDFNKKLILWLCWFHRYHSMEIIQTNYVTGKLLLSAKKWKQANHSSLEGDWYFQRQIDSACLSCRCIYVESTIYDEIKNMKMMRERNKNFSMYSTFWL